MIECSCHGNNPDCYKCGGKGFLTKEDLTPEYKKISYSPRPAKSKVQHNSKDIKKPKAHNILIRLERKKAYAKKRKELINKDFRISKYILEPSAKLSSKKSNKKQRSIGKDDNAQFDALRSSIKNRITTWNPDQLKLMDKIKENIKFMEPHYKANQKINKKKETHPNPYKMRSKNLSGTVHKNKPLYDDKIDHKLDGAKDYWQYREHGRYGSHPDFDDMGDESNP